jgi:hypothetical protein
MELKQINPKTYVLLRQERPVSFVLQSKSNKRKPLLCFDANKRTNRELRYSPNQKSPFVDEQDGTALLEHIVFEDGMLYVPAENQILQAFLHYHPENGRTFEEKDNEKDAIKQLERYDREEDAIVTVRNLNLDECKTLIRIATHEDVNKLTAAEIKHNARVLARNQPEEVLRILSDPLLKVQNIVARAFEDKILQQKGKMRDVYLNNKSHGRTVANRILSVPPGENHIYTVSKFLQSNEGLEVLKLVNTLLETGEE